GPCVDGARGGVAAGVEVDGDQVVLRLDDEADAVPARVPLQRLQRLLEGSPGARVGGGRLPALLGERVEGHLVPLPLQAAAVFSVLRWVPDVAPDDPLGQLAQFDRDVLGDDRQGFGLGGGFVGGIAFRVGSIYHGWSLSILPLVAFGEAASGFFLSWL